jgi:uncharacterized protein YggE
MKNAKNIFWLLLDALLVLCFLLGISTFKALDRYGASLPITRTITVSADAKSIVVPDIAKISFSVVAEGSDPAKLQDENTKKMVAAIDFVKSQVIDSKDIKTAAYNLTPNYEYDEKKRKSSISGYTSTQSLTVTVRDFSKVSVILGKLPSLGVNQIQNVSFDVEDPAKFLSGAREEAFKKAFAKAVSMARQNGVKLGRVVNFNENSPNIIQNFLEPRL